MKLILLVVFLVLVSFVCAETTFFDQDNIFILGKIPSEIDGDNDCRYEWNCTKWGECSSSEKQIRNCTNLGTCSDTHNPPEIEQNCTYVVPSIAQVFEEEKELESENVTEKEGEKTEEGKEEKEEATNRHKIILYSIIGLITVLIILSFKKNYFKKIIQRIKYPENYIR